MATTRKMSGSVMRGVGDETPIWYVIEPIQNPWLGFGWEVNTSLFVGGITIAAADLPAKYFK
jgi:hypothetical protein